MNVTLYTTLKLSDYSGYTLNFVYVSMQVASKGEICLLSDLYSDIEHHFHEFLFVKEMCLLKVVSHAVRGRIRRALEIYEWDVVDYSLKDALFATLLGGLVASGVKIRSFRTEVRYAFRLMSSSLLIVLKYYHDQCL